MIPLVSDAAQQDAGPAEPAHPRRYELATPPPLADLEFYTGGHPFESYREMRENAPVAWLPEDYKTTPGPGFWAVTRYADVRRVELDTETFSSQRGGINLSYGAPETRHPQLYPAALNTMICLDQPYHLPLRREHMPFFTPAYTKALRDSVDKKIDALLDRMEDEGPVVDMVPLFSAELPLFTLCEILGVEDADRPRLIKWMHHLELAADTISKKTLGEIDPAQIMEFMTAMNEMFTYGREALNDRRENPREDLLSAIANATIDGEPLPEPFLDGSWLLIVFAGNDTTRNTLSGTMRLLSEFPDQKQKLVENPELTSGMVDEAIRMVSPVIYMRRTATREAEIAGQRIAEGEKVVMYYGAANRDEAVFDGPDDFDIERKNAKDHIAFGLGPHVCLGQRTANMQLEAAYRKILARFPNVRWTGDIEIAPNNFVHAVSRLEIDLGV
jgi:cytochrome P450